MPHLVARNIPQDLYYRLKIRAIENGKTLRDYVIDALAEHVNLKLKPAPKKEQPKA